MEEINNLLELYKSNEYRFYLPLWNENNKNTEDIKTTLLDTIENNLFKTETNSRKAGDVLTKIVEESSLLEEKFISSYFNQSGIKDPYPIYDNNINNYMNNLTEWLQKYSSILYSLLSEGKNNQNINFEKDFFTFFSSSNFLQQVYAYGSKTLIQYLTKNGSYSTQIKELINDPNTLNSDTLNGSKQFNKNNEKVSKFLDSMMQDLQNNFFSKDQFNLIENQDWLSELILNIPGMKLEQAKRGNKKNFDINKLKKYLEDNGSKIKTITTGEGKNELLEIVGQIEDIASKDKNNAEASNKKLDTKSEVEKLTKLYVEKLNNKLFELFKRYEIDKYKQNNDINEIIIKWWNEKIKPLFGAIQQQYYQKYTSPKNSYFTFLADLKNSLSSGGGIMGDIGEKIFYSVLKSKLKNNIEILGQDKNALNQQAHVDISAKINNNNIGFQIKNFSTAIHSFTLYETSISIFSNDVSRYLNDDQIKKIRFWAINLNTLASKGQDLNFNKGKVNMIKAQILNEIEGSLDNFLRYTDLKSSLDNLKNNFFILNFRIIPSSYLFGLLYQDLFNKKNKKTKIQLFDMQKFYARKNNEAPAVPIENLSFSADDNVGRIKFKGYTISTRNLYNLR